MYEQYYGLQERPFDLSPNPKYLFLSDRHREALNHLRYGLSGRPGITLLLGEAGTGKTTLLRTAVQAQGNLATKMVHLSNPTLTRSEFLEHLAAGFGFSAAAARSKTTLLQELQRALAASQDKPQVLALIVDEAQALPHDLLEEIRLLTNIEATGRSLAVALVGQPELAARLNEPDLRQLKQRVTLRCNLTPLNLQETAAYIATRIRIAGGDAVQVFTRDAVKVIHEHSKGIPRTIGVICDNALVTGFASEARPVGVDIVLEVCRDFDLASDAINAPPPNGRPLPSPAGDHATRPPGPPGRTTPADPPAQRRWFSFY